MPQSRPPLAVFEYDLRISEICVPDTRGVKDIRVYDADNRLRLEWRSTGMVTYYEYMAPKTSRTRQGLKAVQTSRYDSQGRVVEHADPRRGVTSYSYDDQGLASITHCMAASPSTSRSARRKRRG